MNFPCLWDLTKVVAEKKLPLYVSLDGLYLLPDFEVVLPNGFTIRYTNSILFANGFTKKDNTTVYTNFQVQHIGNRVLIAVPLKLRPYKTTLPTLGYQPELVSLKFRALGLTPF